MLTNEQRNIYKYVKSNDKIGKLSIFHDKNEYRLAEELESMGFLSKSIDKNNIEYFKLTDKVPKRKIREKAYKKLNVEGISIPIKRCEKPKFGGRGRKWDYKEHIINGEKGKIHTDVNWGSYLYLSAPDNRWYKIDAYPIYEYIDDRTQNIINMTNKLMDSENLNCEFKF